MKKAILFALHRRLANALRALGNAYLLSIREARTAEVRAVRDPGDHGWGAGPILSIQVPHMTGGNTEELVDGVMIPAAVAFANAVRLEFHVAKWVSGSRGKLWFPMALRKQK